MTIPDKTRGVVYSITCLDFLIVLFDRKLICVTPPCDLSQVTYATSEKHSANTKDDPANTSLGGGKHVANESGETAQGRAYSRHFSVSHRT